MQQNSNMLILSFLICFLAKTNAQNTAADSIFRSIKTQPFSLLFPYIFDENQMNKTSFLMLGDHSIKPYDKNNLMLSSKNDGQLVGLQLEMTKKELDEKAARFKYLVCTQPDKARIEAQKKAEEKLKTKN